MAERIQPSSTAREMLATCVTRAAARPRLSAALMGVRPTRYLLHRTRYLFPRAGVRTLLHTLELYLLSTVVPWNSLGPYFLLRGLTLLFGGMHFGWLEGLRGRVRELYRRHRLGSIRTTTAAWLVGSGLWGGAACLGAISWIILDVDGYASFSVFDAFAIACALRVSVEALARTFHSMLYAVQRVRRPLSSLLLSDAIEPVGLLVLFPTWGLWSFSMVALLGGVIRAYLTYAWTRRTLEGTRLDGPLKWNKRALASAWGDFGRALLPAVASISSQIDAVFLVTLAAFSHGGLLPAIYLARPLLSGVQGALRTFYFDFKRTAPTTPAVLERRYLRRVARFSLVLGAFAGAAMAAAGAIVWGGLGAHVLLALLVFGAVRSLFSLAQVGSFASENYLRLSAASFLVCVAVALAGSFSASLAEIVVVASFSLILGAAWLLSTMRIEPRSSTTYVLRDFLVEVARTKEPAVVFSGEIQTDCRIPLGKVLHELTVAFPTWSFFRDGRRRLLGIARDAQQGEQGVSVSLVEASAGLLRRVRTEAFSSGTSWVSRLAAGHVAPLSPEHLRLIALAREAPPEPLSSVVAELLKSVPGMHAIALESAAELGRIEPSSRLLALSGLAKDRRSKGVFAALFPGDVKNAWLLFCLTNGDNRDQVALWQGRLQIAALRAVLHEQGA